VCGLDSSCLVFRGGSRCEVVGVSRCRVVRCWYTVKICGGSAWLQSPRGSWESRLEAATSA
jgi:hypothetical protein